MGFSYESFSKYSLTNTIICDGGFASESAAFSGNSNGISQNIAVFLLPIMEVASQSNFTDIYTHTLTHILRSKCKIVRRFFHKFVLKN